MAILFDAFQRTLNARERVVGVREKITLGVTQLDALVTDVNFDGVFLPGGIGNDGGFICQVGKDILPVQPTQYTSISVRGQSLQVMSVKDVNGIVWEITAGDPIASVNAT